MLDWKNMEVVLFLLVATVVSLLLVIAKLRRTNKNLFSTLVEQAYLADSSQQDKIKEDFLKFVSDSREWAFNYIEDVQNQIEQIISDMKPIIDKVESKKKKSAEEKSLINVFSRLKKLLPEQGN